MLAIVEHVFIVALLKGNPLGVIQPMIGYYCRRNDARVTTSNLGTLSARVLVNTFVIIINNRELYSFKLGSCSYLFEDPSNSKCVSTPYFPWWSYKGKGPLKL